MKDLLGQADEIPVTLTIAIACITLLFLTNPFGPPDEFQQRLVQYGMMAPLGVSSGEPWRLVTTAFLHGGVVHIAFNLMMLAQIGPALERTLGSVRFALLYLVAAVGGNLAVCLWYAPDQSVVGGSGALFGLLGALVALHMRAGHHAFAMLDHHGPRQLLGMILANLAICWIIPFVSNTAHVGGLVTGFAMTLLWLVPPRAGARPPWAWRAAMAALFASALFASLVPVTRYDWLWNQGVAEMDPARRAALQRAAAMDYYGRSAADDALVESFYRAAVESPDDRGK